MLQLQPMKLKILCNFLITRIYVNISLMGISFHGLIMALVILELVAELTNDWLNLIRLIGILILLWII